jgi:hypothetical protein
MEILERFRDCGPGLSVLKLAAMLSACSLASAGILFERDLPTSGLNLSGVSRSNIAAIEGSISGTPFVLGDNFTLAGTGSFQVNSITVWIVGNCPVTTCTPTDATPSSEFSSIQLFGGLDNGTNGPVSLLSSSYVSTHVQYTGGLDYLSTSGSGLSYPIFQLTFASLGLVIPGSQLYDFAVEGTPTGNNTFALHASTAAISGGIQQGADNQVFGYEGSPLSVAFGIGAGGFSNFANGADVNVLVVGVPIATPEPSTSALYSMGLGVVALAAFRRSRNRPLHSTN